MGPTVVNDIHDSLNFMLFTPPDAHQSRWFGDFIVFHLISRRKFGSDVGLPLLSHAFRSLTLSLARDSGLI